MANNRFSQIGTQVQTQTQTLTPQQLLVSQWSVLNEKDQALVLDLIESLGKK